MAVTTAATTKAWLASLTGWLVLTGMTAVSLATPLVWVQQRVAREIAGNSRYAHAMRVRWLADVRRLQGLEHHWREDIARIRAAEAHQRVALVQLAKIRKDIAAKTVAINRLTIQLDQITGASLAPLPSAAKMTTPNAIPSISLPNIPASPPPVHTVTGASGVP